MRVLFVFDFFQPQSLIDELLLYKRSEDQIELKEKQLSTMRVDVCSTETLKCLKGKGSVSRTNPDGGANTCPDSCRSSSLLLSLRPETTLRCKMPEFLSAVKNRQAGAENLR